MSALDTSAGRFKQYVLGQIAQCQRDSKNVRNRIAAHDLSGARQAWRVARNGWEKSDVVSGEIGAWPDAARERIGWEHGAICDKYDIFSITDAA
jgi:hypothetical protein